MNRTFLSTGLWSLRSWGLHPGPEIHAPGRPPSPPTGRAAPPTRQQAAGRAPSRRRYPVAGVLHRRAAAAGHRPGAGQQPRPAAGRAEHRKDAGPLPHPAGRTVADGQRAGIGSKQRVPGILSQSGQPATVRAVQRQPRHQLLGAGFLRPHPEPEGCGTGAVPRHGAGPRAARRSRWWPQWPTPT